MKEHDDPRRLSDDADDVLGELVRAATRDVPDETRIDAMLEGVLREVGDGGDGGGDGGGGGSDGATAAGAKASGAWLATGAGKIGVALGVAAVGAGVIVSAVRSSEAPPVGAQSSTVVAAQEAPAREDARVAAPSAELSSAEPASTAIASAAASPEARSSAARAVPAAATTASVIASATPSASSEPVDPRAELALLTEARAALSSSPARALSLAEEHARRFPQSQLGQERSALRIQALAALGRTTEARAELEAFRARNPRSAYLPTLDALLAR